MRHRVARYVRAGKVCVVTAEEVQSSMANVEAADEDTRRCAVVQFGEFATEDGSELVFVQSYTRRNADHVHAHFRLSADVGEGGNAEHVENYLRGDGAAASDSRLLAMRLLKANVGKWEVTEWCCPQRKSAFRWTCPPNAKAVLYHRYSNERIAPVAVLDAQSNISLLVYFGALKCECARLPLCRLSSESVIQAFSSPKRVRTSFTNLDSGSATCGECLNTYKLLREEETARGEAGIRGVMVPIVYGNCVPMTPDDLLTCRGCFVHWQRGEAQLPVGYCGALANVPSGWKPRIRVIRPDAQAVPVKIQWKPGD